MLGEVAVGAFTATDEFSALGEFSDGSLEEVSVCCLEPLASVFRFLFTCLSFRSSDRIFICMVDGEFKDRKVPDGVSAFTTVYKEHSI